MYLYVSLLVNSDDAYGDTLGFFDTLDDDLEYDNDFSPLESIDSYKSSPGDKAKLVEAAIAECVRSKQSAPLIYMIKKEGDLMVLSRKEVSAIAQLDMNCVYMALENKVSIESERKIGDVAEVFTEAFFHQEESHELSRPLDNIHVVECLLDIDASNNQIWNIIGKLTDDEDAKSLILVLIEHNRYTLVQQLIHNEDIKYDPSFTRQAIKSDSFDILFMFRHIYPSSFTHDE